MIRTILFDFGNVLAFFDHRRAIENLQFHTKMEPTELALVLYGGELEIAYENGQISTAKYFEIAKEDGRLLCSLDQFVAAFVDIFMENTDVTALVPRLKKRYRLLLASNTNDAHFKHYRKRFEPRARSIRSFGGVARNRRPQAAPALLRTLSKIRELRARRMLVRRRYAQQHPRRRGVRLERHRADPTPALTWSSRMKKLGIEGLE